LTCFSNLLVKFRKLCHWAEVDLAVIYGLLANSWGFLAGPVTLLLIVTHFSPVLQGYYYTFTSVLALRVFVELGLGTVIVQFASHEWSNLALNDKGRITGDQVALSRLQSLGRVAFFWYLVAGVIIALGLSIGGYYFFSLKHFPDINWQLPWITLCILSGMNMVMVPIWSLLEGCNQVAQIYGYRVIQGILGNLSIWAAILLGAGLWAPVASSCAGLLWAGLFLAWKYRAFLGCLCRKKVGACISWRDEIWPLQWRIGLSWLSGYFLSPFIVTILFYYHGPVVGGQMGITWNLIGVIGGMASLLTTTKIPKFGILIAKKQYEKLDQLFFRVASSSITLIILGSLALWAGDYLLYAYKQRFASRLLPPLPTALFLLGNIAMYSSSPFAAYLRAHKKEPFLSLSIVSGILIGLSTCLLGSRYAAVGAAMGYFAVSAFYTLPHGLLIWRRCRTAWHAEPQNDPVLL
jgi:hypothetical protein